MVVYGDHKEGVMHYGLQLRWQGTHGAFYREEMWLVAIRVVMQMVQFVNYIFKEVVEDTYVELLYA